MKGKQTTETSDVNDDPPESKTPLPSLRSGLDKARKLTKLAREAAQERCTDWYTVSESGKINCRELKRQT